MSMLELRQVSKSYGEGANEVDAISDIDLAVERGSLAKTNSIEITVQGV